MVVTISHRFINFNILLVLVFRRALLQLRLLLVVVLGLLLGLGMRVTR
jgi:hypothetical protein